MDTIAYLTGVCEADKVYHSGKLKGIDPMRYAEMNQKELLLLDEEITEFVAGWKHECAMIRERKNKWDEYEKEVIKKISINNVKRARKKRNEGLLMFMMCLMMRHRH